MKKDLGFIILRHVRDEVTNSYWINCYKCIRFHYPEANILIVDDNSNDKYVTTSETLYKVTIINSEYPGRGEILPYYYYLHNKLFEVAVIFHDAVFMNKYMDFNIDIDNYEFLWHFEHHWDQIEDETKMINVFNDDELKRLHQNKNEWKGCFGAMCIIKYEYLKQVCEKYDIRKLFDLITTRHNRCSFERVISCLLHDHSHKKYSLLGRIHDYCPFGMNINQVIGFTHLPLIKVWSGR